MIYVSGKCDVPDRQVQAEACPVRQKREPILGSTRWFRERGLYPQAKSMGGSMGNGSKFMGEDSK
jgi:hypothetical protein